MYNVYIYAIYSLNYSNFRYLIVHTFFFFSSPAIAERTDSGENHINENIAGSMRNKVPSDLPEEFSTKEDEIQTNVVVSNKTKDLAICQDQQQIIDP